MPYIHECLAYIVRYEKYKDDKFVQLWTFKDGVRYRIYICYVVMVYNTLLSV